jgi:myo-inositol 2-dehydrogenase/D-chiro-inositol 1-dehydrogenase
MAHFLMGEEVEEIYTAAGVMIDPEIGKAGDLDTAVVVLRFRGGAIATIDNSRRASYGYDQRVEILGSLGKIETENRYPNQACISTAKSVSRDLPLNFFMDRYEQSFVVEMESFANAIMNGHPTAVPGNDGRIATVMALAARKSYDERRPVKIEEVSA